MCSVEAVDGLPTPKVLVPRDLRCSRNCHVVGLVRVGRGFPYPLPDCFLEDQDCRGQDFARKGDRSKTSKKRIIASDSSLPGSFEMNRNSSAGYNCSGA